MGHLGVIGILIHTALNRVQGKSFPCLLRGGFLEGLPMSVVYFRLQDNVCEAKNPEVMRAATRVVFEGYVPFDEYAHPGYYALS